MPEFTTRFEGLIVHTNLGDKWVSAMIAADQHETVLAVPTTAIASSTLNTVTPAKEGETWFDITGQFVTCDLPPGVPTRDLTFDAGIAHLATIADAGATPRLTATTTAVDPDAFRSLFRLPAGQLFGVDFFSHAARFGTLQEVRCVAQAVELASNTTASTVTFSTTNGTVTVNVDGGKVRFQNISPGSIVNLDEVTPPGNEANDHFRFYGRFFTDDSVGLQTPRTDDNFHCTQAGKVETRISVECSNTQYP